jgi:hypothetical protein
VDWCGNAQEPAIRWVSALRGRKNMQLSRSLRRALWPTAFAALLLAVPAGSHSAFAATRYAPGADYTAAGSQVGTPANTGVNNNGYAGPGNSYTAPSTSYSGGAGPYLPPDSTLVVPRQLLGDYTAQFGTVPSATFCNGLDMLPGAPQLPPGPDPILQGSLGPDGTCYINGDGRGTNSVMGPSTIQIFTSYLFTFDPNNSNNFCVPIAGNAIITSNTTPTNQLNISFYMNWCGPFDSPVITDQGNFTVTGGTGEFINATGGGTIVTSPLDVSEIVLNGTVKP